MSSLRKQLRMGIAHSTPLAYFSPTSSHSIFMKGSHQQQVLIGNILFASLAAHIGHISCSHHPDPRRITIDQCIFREKTAGVTLVSSERSLAPAMPPRPATARAGMPVARPASAAAPPCLAASHEQGPATTRRCHPSNQGAPWH